MSSFLPTVTIPVLVSHVVTMVAPTDLMRQLAYADTYERNVSFTHKLRQSQSNRLSFCEMYEYLKASTLVLFFLYQTTIICTFSQRNVKEQY